MTLRLTSPGRSGSVWTMAEKLYILDGHSQMFRAYWARTPELTSPAGEPTKATYVFCTMLLKLINEQKPAYLAMAIDGPRDKLLRRQRYDHQSPYQFLLRLKMNLAAERLYGYNEAEALTKQIMELMSGTCQRELETILEQVGAQPRDWQRARGKSHTH